MTKDIPHIDFEKGINKIKDKWIPASRKDNTGIGFTLETELEIRENNYAKHDFIDNNRFKDTRFELKAQRVNMYNPTKPKPRKVNDSYISLVTQAPHGGSKNSELIKKYGYADSKGRERRNLYATLRATKFVNGKNVKNMKITREENKLFIVHKEEKLSNYDLTTFTDKLANLVVVRTDSEWRKCSCKKDNLHDETGQYHEFFNFKETHVFTDFSLEKFYKVIDEGNIFLDLRMHIPTDKTPKEASYDTFHDHGTGFRAKFKTIPQLYDKEIIL